MREYSIKTSWLVLLIVLLALVAGGYWFAWYVGSGLHTWLSPNSLTRNLLFFILINANIVVIMVLVFLVFRNLVKLVIDRRRNIAGSRLRSRLVVAFVGLSLIPTVLLFLIAKGILAAVMQGWFSPQITGVVDGAVDIATHHYEYREQILYRDAERMAKELGALSSLSDDAHFIKNVYAIFDKFFNQRNLTQLALLAPDKSIIAERRAKSVDVDVSRDNIPRGAANNDHIPLVPNFNPIAIQQAFNGEIVVKVEHLNDVEFLRAYIGVPAKVVGEQLSDDIMSNTVAPQYVMVATDWISPYLSDVLGKIIEASDDYRELYIDRRPLASTYLLILFAVTLLIVFAAIWVGFYLAKTLAEPIKELAQGTQQIAKGNLSFRIPEIGDDEFTVLVRSFNTMTSDLQNATAELIARRRYMETVLQSVSVGVLSVDGAKNIRTCNAAAGRILGVSDLTTIIGKICENVVPVEIAQELKSAFDSLTRSYQEHLASVSVTVDNKRKHVQLSAAPLIDAEGNKLGVVILLDDVTELVKAQRMVAWREVARRIAHEIKNPLTPIQLSAQRIQRRFDCCKLDNTRLVENSQEMEGKSLKLLDDDLTMVFRCTEIIIEQVQVLRRLVNEFSRFARMPKTSPHPTNANDMVTSIWEIYRNGNPDISFLLKLDEQVGILQLDREQMVRVLVNLVDNAVASVQAKRAEIGDAYVPEIVFQTHLDDELSLVSILVGDNGLGIAEGDRNRVFEPHFSTKKGGTGLGLAIVNSIVADHNGFVRIRDFIDGGVAFIIEVPHTRQKNT